MILVPRRAIRVGNTLVWDDGTVQPIVDPDAFVTMVTRPTWENTGPNPNLGDLDPYTGPSAGGLLTISQNGGTVEYKGVDFGTTRIRHTGTCDLVLEDCKAINTRASYGSSAAQPMVDARQAGKGMTYLRRVHFENFSQSDGNNTGVLGWRMQLDRVGIRGFTDNGGSYVPGSPGGTTGQTSTWVEVEVKDTYLGPMGWYWNPDTGVVHPSDTKTHNDDWQHQGGYGLRLLNVHADATYATNVGTGTPGSGSDMGPWPGTPTYADGVAARYQIVEGNGLYSPGQPGALLGGSVAGFMFTMPVSKGYVLSTDDHPLLIDHCWGNGGGYWLNAGATIVGPFGEVRNCLVKPDQRTPGWAIGIKGGVSADVHDNYEADDDWNNTGVPLVRRNA